MGVGIKLTRRNIGVNAALNTIKTLLTIAFPIVTVPYLSRTLGKSEYGKFNYSVSIVSYFALIAGLGFTTYAIREGAKVRGNSKQINVFASEVFTLNVLSTVLSYILLAILLMVATQLSSYKSYIMILSVNILFVTLGADWINSIYEDYLYITVRYIIVQVSSLIFMFVFVKSAYDLINYTIIYLFSQVGANLMNMLYIRKYVHLKMYFSKNIFKHVAPVMILFVSNLAMTLYVNSDITLLGILKNNAAVGVYSVASKVYAGAKQIVVAGTVVTIPRLSAYIGEKNRLDYDRLLNNIFNMLISLTVPVFTGLFMLSNPVMKIMGGKSFSSGAPTLQLLCIASIFSIVSYFYAQCVLIPNKREKFFLYATLLAAVVNISFNFIMIPLLSHMGAALTTVLAELVVMLFCRHYSKGFGMIVVDKNTILSVVTSSIAIIVICYISLKIFSSDIMALIVATVLSAVSFLAIMFVMKNVYILSLFSKMIQKVRNNG